MRRTKRVKIYGMFVDDEYRYVGAVLRILDDAPPSQAGAVELRWIKRMWRDGHRLINERLTPWRAP